MHTRVSNDLSANQPVKSTKGAEMFVIKADNGFYCEFLANGGIVLHSPRRKIRATKFENYERAEWALNNLKKVPKLFDRYTICVHNDQLRAVS